MIDGNTIKDTKEMVSQKAHNEIFSNDISPKGTLLMSFKLTIGKVSILDIDSFHNEAIISIYPYYDEGNTLRDYLFKVLPLISNYGNTKNAIKGKTLNSKSINNLLIPIADLNELKKITCKIVKLEDNIKNYSNKYLDLENLNKNYKEELKKSILQYAIQGKLVKQDPDDESAEILINKILNEKRELIKTKQIRKENLSVIYKDSADNQFYEKFDDGTINNITDEIPFDIPENWCWTRLSNILSVKGGKRIPKGEKLIDNKTAHIYIRVTDMKNNTISDEKIKYINNSVYEQIKNYIISSDDLYLTIAGTIGNIGVVPEKYNNMNLTENAVKLCNISINKKILLYFLQSSYVQLLFNDKTNKVAQPKLAINRIETTLFPLPPQNEQIRIITKIEQLLNLIK